MKRLVFIGLFLILAVSVFAATNTVTVSGTYDFTVNNGCSATVTTKCLQQFNVYEISGATPVKLGSVAAPAGANTATAAVSGSFTIPALVAGVHTFGIAAQMADGTESDPKAPGATSTQTVKPGVPIGLSLTAS